MTSGLGLHSCEPTALAQCAADVSFALNGAQDEDGWTALHFAATKGHVELVELLLRSRADHAIKVAFIFGTVRFHLCS